MTDKEDDDLPPLEAAIDTVRISENKAETDKKDDIPRAEGATGRVAGDDYVLNLGNQEVERILNELEENCDLVIETAGKEAWLPVDGMQNVVNKALGYEDVDQLEDALQGSLLQFLEALPHIETKIQDDGSSVDGQPVFRKRVPPAHYSKAGIRMRVQIKESKDLWRTLLKAPEATISIPEMEFEAGTSQKRQIDSIFNHFSQACFNLGQHIRFNQDTMSENVREKIADCIDQINNLLDIPHPWELVVTDPTGESLIMPNDGVVIELLSDDAAKVAEEA